MRTLSDFQRDVIGALRIFGFYGVSENVRAKWEVGSTFYPDSRLGLSGHISKAIDAGNAEATKC